MKHLTSIAAGALLGLTALAGPALAQGSSNSLTIVRGVDSDRYDPHRSTARAASASARATAAASAAVKAAPEIHGTPEPLARTVGLVAARSPPLFSI